MNTVIRPPNVKDARQIAEAHVRVWQETYRGVMPDEFLDALSVEKRTERHAASIARGDGYLVAEEDGKILGFLCFGPSRDDAAQGEIYAINLVKEAHGRGIGKKMMQMAAATLQAAGHTELHLWVVEGNKPARAFYEKLNGVTSGELKSRDFGGKNVTEVKYSWKKFDNLRP